MIRELVTDATHIPNSRIGIKFFVLPFDTIDKGTFSTGDQPSSALTESRKSFRLEFHLLDVRR